LYLHKRDARKRFYVVGRNQSQLPVSWPVKEEAMKVKEESDTDNTGTYRSQVTYELATSKYDLGHEENCLYSFEPVEFDPFCYDAIW